MNIIKKTIATLFVSSFLIAASNVAYAEEATEKTAEKAVEKSTDNDAKSISEVITHLEQGAALAAQSDFSAATLHLKVARSTAGEINGHALGVHKGVAHINTGMKEVKLGHPDKAVAELNAAIETFKAM